MHQRELPHNVQTSNRETYLISSPPGTEIHFGEYDFFLFLLHLTLIFSSSFAPPGQQLSGIERRRGGCPLLLRRSSRRTPTSKSHLVQEASARISEPKPMVRYTDVAPASFNSKSSKSP